MSRWDSLIKRLFDLGASAVGLVLLWWLIAIAVLAATVDTRTWGVFRQRRVGRNGEPFLLMKIRTMKPVPGVTTTVTGDHDPRITRLGRVLRKSKLDELPQLFHVLAGTMSFVGPRPDVPGFADLLQGDDRLVLSVKPGITGPASLHFRNEETLLAEQQDPELYNREVIFPQKVRINLDYVENYSFRKDLGYILETILGA